jgi:hypothetical protein
VLIRCGLLVPREPVKDRLWSVLGGAVYLGYGIYVAKQTSGTYASPIAIFALPILGFLYLIGSTLSRASKSAPRSNKNQ